MIEEFDYKSHLLRVYRLFNKRKHTERERERGQSIDRQREKREREREREKHFSLKTDQVGPRKEIPKSGPTLIPIQGLAENVKRIT